VAVSLVIAAWLGCAAGSTGCKRTPSTSLPATPPEAVRAIVHRLESNEPQAVWEAMPPSYQAELRDLIGVFCAHMDPQVYDRLFRILNKSVRVLQEKEEFFSKSPVALSMPMLENLMGQRWHQVVSLLRTVATSDLATLDSLRRMDPGQFLASTGREVMAISDQLRRESARSPQPNPWQKLGEALDAAHIQFQPEGQDQGWLRFNSTTNKLLKDVELVRVDGKWLPKSMAEAWKDRMAKAREGLAKLDGPESQKMKPVASLVMGTLENTADALLRAKSQKDFDEALKSLLTINTLVSSLRSPSP
jgi:hypothetical protein